MTRMLASLMFVLGTACVAAVALPPPAGAPATRPLTQNGRAIMTFEEDEHDFGEILDNKDVDMTFKFRNAGDADLVIERLDADCGCTVPDLDKWVYAPGEEGEIRVRYDTVQGVYADKARKIRVLSNDYRGVPREISVTGMVRPIAYTTPGFSNFANARKGQTASMTIEVAGRAKDFKVTGVSVTDTEHFGVSVLDSRPTRGRFGDILRGTTIEVRFNGSPEVEQFKDTITITTNDPRRPTLEVPLTASIARDIEIRPNPLRIKPRRAGEPGDAKMMLRHKFGESFKILEIKTESGSLELTEATAEPLDTQYGVGYIISVAGITGDDTEPGNVEGELVIVTDVHGELEIRVPVVMRIVRDVSAPVGSRAGGARGGRDG